METTKKRVDKDWNRRLHYSSFFMKEDEFGKIHRHLSRVRGKIRERHYGVTRVETKYVFQKVWTKSQGHTGRSRSHRKKRLT